MNMSINIISSDDFIFSGNDICCWIYNNVDIIYYIWVVGIIYGENIIIFNVYISFNYFIVIDNNGIRNDKVCNVYVIMCYMRILCYIVFNRFIIIKSSFFIINCIVFFYLSK